MSEGVITLLALDIDGVLTDGSVTVDESGHEQKTLFYRDIDAVFQARREGIKIILVTGEDSQWVTMIAKRLQVDGVYQGAKDKCEAIRLISAERHVPLTDICFVGDSQRDAEAFPLVGLALAPTDAVEEARKGAHCVLKCSGGRGAVAEAVELLLARRKSRSPRLS
jgi:3-deoxy-D-manno-octulosonate 8-phosphate phosphatase (KDO 8-P phosphatase)